MPATINIVKTLQKKVEVEVGHGIATIISARRNDHFESRTYAAAACAGGAISIA